MRPAARREQAFTTVELVIVLLIGALLVALGIPLVQTYLDSTRTTQSVIEIGEMSKAIRNIERTTGTLPDALDDAGFADRRDPWGFPYEYLNLRTLKGNGKARQDKKLKPLNSDFDLYSVGPDGQTQASLLNSKSRDDVIRARDGGFIGTAMEFDP